MDVLAWLLDGDPSIRWQVMRDLDDAPAHEVAAERARVATEGWGVRLLALQAADGRWGGAAWTRFAFPTWWHYDVLRGLDHLHHAGTEPDERCAEAIELVANKRGPEGRWRLEHTHPGRVHFEMEEGDGTPSRWITLRAMRVLDWYQAASRAT